MSPTMLQRKKDLGVTAGSSLETMAWCLKEGCGHHSTVKELEPTTGARHNEFHPPLGSKVSSTWYPEQHKHKDVLLITEDVIKLWNL